LQAGGRRFDPDWLQLDRESAKRNINIPSPREGEGRSRKARGATPSPLPHPSPLVGEGARRADEGAVQICTGP
jgi:hypothetical protein